MGAATTGPGEPSRESGAALDRGDLAVRLSDLARDLQNEDDAQRTLEAITEAAVGTVPGAEYAALTVVQDRREVHTVAATGDLALRVDECQYETGEGPCLDAAYEHRTVRLADMRTEQRWPAFTRCAAELGVLSMVSFQLYVHNDNLGALNLYSRHADAFDDESEHVGLLFAAHAAVAMSGAQHQEQMDRALAARDVIGQAKGILMERHRLTGDQAFAILVRASQDANLKLIEVARALTDTGELAERPRRT